MTDEVNHKIMEKKAYIVPCIEVVNAESAEMIATSAPQIDIVKPGENGENGENTGTDILSNKRRGTWGNLWEW